MKKIKIHQCIVDNCDNNNVKELFKLPSDETKKRIWLNNLNIKEPLPNKASKVCLRHFNKKDINVTAFKTVLKTTAIPLLILSEDMSEIEMPLSSINNEQMDTIETTESLAVSSNLSNKQEALSNIKKDNVLRKLKEKSKVIRNVKRKFERQSLKYISLKDALDEVQNKIGIEASINDYLKSCSEGKNSIHCMSTGNVLKLFLIFI